MRIYACILTLLLAANGAYSQPPQQKPPGNKPDAKPMDMPQVETDPLKIAIAELKEVAVTKRRNAVLKLARMGPAAQPAIPALIELLRDKEREIRLLAAYALEKIETGK